MTADPLLPAHLSARVPRVLSVAGTDPTGGAGVHADLKSIAATGGYGMGAVTAVVAQNTRGVRSVHVPPVEVLDAQLRAVSDDVVVDAVKIGMLGTAAVARTVHRWLSDVRPPVVVLDPVMVATSGDRLLDADAEAALRALLPLADVVTPNVPELAVLAGEPVATTWEGLLDQARRVAAEHGVLVLAKGGHLAGGTVRDALVGGTADEPFVVSRPRVDTTSTHGTGCSLSSALATLRATGLTWPQAVREATDWLADALVHGAELEVGTGHGPVSHFAALWDRVGLPGARSAEVVAAQWWDDVAGVRAQIEELDFVRRLGDGTLDRAAFLDYLAQDALYLRDYSRVLATASTLAPTAAEQSFWAGAARQAIVAELALHGSFLTEDALFDARSGPATTAYLDHLLAAAARGDYDVLVAALLPCFWLYDHVGRLLHPQSHPGHPYAAWLDTYADPEFGAQVRQAVEIVTARAARADTATRVRMWRAFEVSSRHEHAFFAAPLLGAGGGLGTDAGPGATTGPGADAGPVRVPGPAVSPDRG